MTDNSSSNENFIVNRTDLDATLNDIDDGVFVPTQKKRGRAKVSRQ